MAISNKDALIAKLSTKVDHLETELSYLNRILKEVGFPEGIVSLKSSVEELLEQETEGHQHEIMGF